MRWEAVCTRRGSAVGRGNRAFRRAARPLHDLNLRFLDLVGSHQGGAGSWGAAGSLDLPGGASARLGHDRLAEAAARIVRTRYSICAFTTRLIGMPASRVRALAGRGRGAEEDIANFVRLALFYAWHVATTTRHAARLLLA